MEPTKSIRAYEIKDMSPENIKRSLQKAASESIKGKIIGLFLLEACVDVPECVAIQKRINGDILLEAETCGEVVKDKLSGEDMLYVQAPLSTIEPGVIDVRLGIKRIKYILIKHPPQKKEVSE